MQQSSIWLTIYADIITNLTLFFLMSYAFTRMDESKRTNIQSALTSMVSKDAAMTDRAQRILKQIQEQEAVSKLDSEKEKLDKLAKLEVNDKMIRILLTSPVLFETGKVEITKETALGLDEIAKSLKALPNKVVVEGHTDNIPLKAGRYTTNWELSIARAVSVIDYFTKVKGMSSEKFIVAGYGEFRPLYPNDTPENRAQNRRIEINVIR